MGWTHIHICMHQIISYSLLHARDAFIFAFACMRYFHSCICTHEMTSYSHEHSWDGFIDEFACMRWFYICICMHEMISYLQLHAWSDFIVAFAFMRWILVCIHVHELFHSYICPALRQISGFFSSTCIREVCPCVEMRPYTRWLTQNLIFEGGKVKVGKCFVGQSLSKS